MCPSQVREDHVLGPHHKIMLIETMSLIPDILYINI